MLMRRYLGGGEFCNINRCLCVIYSNDTICMKIKNDKDPMSHKSRPILLYFFLIAAAVSLGDGQTAYFADGYHGGMYGHYPMWQAKFMVDKLNEFPDWKINLEIEPETWDEVNEKDPDNFKRLQEYYETKGRFGRIEFANPSYAQPYCYNISGESIIRQFVYGMEKVTQHFPNAVFKTYSCEEPCFTSCLPQILTSLGYEYAVLRCPNTCWGGYTSGFGKDLVNWKSSDGSSILTVPRYGCEELVKTSTFETSSNRNSPDFIKACFDNGIKYPVGMCFQDAGWRGGPWLGSIVRRFYEPTEYVTWTDYIEMIAPEVTPADWKFTIEDVKPGLVWGAPILQKLAQEVRYTENRLVMAEKMAAFDAVCHMKSYPESQFDSAWRSLMLSQHHDCWIVPYNGRPGGNWATNVTEWTRLSNQIADQVIANVFADVPGSPVGSRHIKVFNTLGIQRTDIAKAALPADMDPAAYKIQNADGQLVKSQVLTTGGDTKELVFEATVPAMGYSTYTLVQKEQNSDKISVQQLHGGSIRIDTNYYAAIIDPAKGGAITRLVAKNMGNTQLVEDGKTLNSLRGYFYNEEKFVSTADKPARVSVVENGALLVRLKIESELEGSPYTQLVTFYENHPRIDFDLNIDWKGQPGIGAYSQGRDYRAEEWKKAFYNDKYKLQVEFPVKDIGSKVFKNAPFDVCASRLEDTYYDSWGTIKHNVILNWVDVTDDAGKLGVALFSDHTTSYIHSDPMPLGLTVQYTGRALWGRNYRLHGPTHIHYAILPHAGAWDEYGVHAHSTAWNEPLAASFTGNKPAEVEKSLLDVATEGIEVTSAVMDGSSLLIRLFNAEADFEMVKVNLHCDADKIELVELNGNVVSEIKPAKIDRNTQQIGLKIPRFGIRTIRLSNPR